MPLVQPQDAPPYILIRVFVPQRKALQRLLCVPNAKALVEGIQEEVGIKESVRKLQSSISRCGRLCSHPITLALDGRHEVLSESRPTSFHYAWQILAFLEFLLHE